SRVVSADGELATSTFFFRARRPPRPALFPYTTLFRSGRTDEAMAIVRSDSGKLEMDAVRAQVASMAQEETRARGQRLIEMDGAQDRKSTRLNSSHVKISYAVFCSKKKSSARRDERTRT